MSWNQKAEERLTRCKYLINFDLHGVRAIQPVLMCVEPDRSTSCHSPAAGWSAALTPACVCTHTLICRHDGFSGVVQIIYVQKTPRTSCPEAQICLFFSSLRVGEVYVWRFVRYEESWQVFGCVFSQRDICNRQTTHCSKNIALAHLRGTGALFCAAKPHTCQGKGR